jgi:hypothetical protein
MDECPICKEEIKENDICKTKCGHRYCLSCMLTHSKSNNRCPLCRVELFEMIESEEETESESEEEVETYYTRMHRWEFHGKMNNRELHGKIFMNNNLCTLLILTITLFQCNLINTVGVICSRMKK